MGTLWSKVPGTKTSYGYRDVPDKGAIMDDSVYTMDSLLINMDDEKLQPIFAPATAYQGRYIALLGALGDDPEYIGDDPILTGQDTQLNQGFAAPTLWT